MLLSLSAGRPTFRAPLAAAVAVAALVACGRSGTSTGPATAFDNTITISVSPSTVSQGDSAAVVVVWPNSAYGATVVITLSGAATGTQSFAIPQGANELTGTIAIPAAFPDGTIDIQASIAAIGGSAQASLIVKDYKPPVIASAYVASALPLPPMVLTNTVQATLLADIDFVAGTTDTAVLTLSDNHGLAWAGWAFDYPYSFRDSVPISGLTTTALVPMSIPSSLIGATPSLSVFVRDSDGNQTVTTFGATSVGQYVDHPLRTVAFAAAVSDFAFDTKRQTLYLLERDSMRIAVLSLASLTFQQPITLPHTPIGLDVTPSHDSLFVMLDSTNVVAVINLAVGGHPTTLVHLAPVFDSIVPNDTVTIGWRIRIAADNRALIVMRSADTGHAAVVELNLATDSQRVIAPPANFTFSSALDLRSPDALTVILPTIPLPPGTSYGLTAYNAFTHVYSSGPAPLSAADGDQLLSSLSSAPSVYLGGRQVYDPTFRLLGHVGFDGLWGGVIAPNGAETYVAESQCQNQDVACMDTGRGVIVHQTTPPGGTYGALSQLIDASDAPEPATRLLISPDGTTLIGLGAHLLMAFDLTRSGPPPGSRRARTPVTAARIRTAQPSRAPVIAVQQAPKSTQSGRALAISGIRLQRVPQRQGMH